MWDKIKGFVTGHPMAVAGLVGAIVLLYIVSRINGASSGAGSGGPSEGLQAQQLAAGVQIAGIQASAGASNNQTNASLSAALAGFGTQEFIAQLQTTLGAANIGATRDVSIATINGETVRAGYDRDVSIATINALARGNGGTGVTPGASEVNFAGVDWGRANQVIDSYAGFSGQSEWDAFRRTYTAFTGDFGQGRFEAFEAIQPRTSQVSYINALVQRKVDPDYIAYEIGHLRNT